MKYPMGHSSLDFFNIGDMNCLTTELAYSYVGWTRLRYALSLADFRQLERFLFTKLSILDAFNMMVFICVVKYIVLSRIMPKKGC